MDRNKFKPRTFAKRRPLKKHLLSDHQKLRINFPEFFHSKISFGKTIKKPTLMFAP